MEHSCNHPNYKYPVQGTRWTCPSCDTEWVIGKPIEGWPPHHVWERVNSTLTNGSHK